jgi:hypothetical protein
MGRGRFVMGLFDFLRRKPDGPPKADPVEGDLDEPRCHHYTLAHYALRIMAFQEPLSFLGILASPQRQPFLVRLLQRVSEHCKERESRPDFRIEDIAVHQVRVGPYPCAILEMPRPRAMSEAYFVAAVLLTDLEKGMPEAKEVALRYFTLEKGLAFGGPPRTVLCEWTADGTHHNFGDGPAPRLGSFIEAVQELLSKSV